MHLRPPKDLLCRLLPRRQELVLLHRTGAIARIARRAEAEAGTRTRTRTRTETAANTGAAGADRVHARETVAAIATVTVSTGTEAVARTEMGTNGARGLLMPFSLGDCAQTPCVCSLHCLTYALQLCCVATLPILIPFFSRYLSVLFFFFWLSLSVRAHNSGSDMLRLPLGVPQSS